MAGRHTYADPQFIEVRERVLELVAAAVTAGTIHLYDVEPLAKTYMDILVLGPESYDKQDDEPPAEAVVTRKAKH